MLLKRPFEGEGGNHQRIEDTNTEKEVKETNYASYEIIRYILTTVDPVHIGTGGRQLHRVDKTIVREPGTKLPIIPGTTLSGAIRQYAANSCKKPECAGFQNQCNDMGCEICYTFGTANEAGGGNEGVVSIGDAKLLLFPVYSVVGPVWITSPDILRVFQIDLGFEIQKSKAVFCGELSKYSYLSLGWFLVENLETPANIESTSNKDNEIKEHFASKLPENIPPNVINRIVVIDDDVFSDIVNVNLEERTSISVDTETRSAEAGALFTYEAIPRAAFLWVDVTIDNYRSDIVGRIVPEHHVSEGLNGVAHVGVGGMTTRGFGRIKKISEKKIFFTQP